MNKFVMCLLMLANIAVQTPVQAIKLPFIQSTEQKNRDVVQLGESVKDVGLTVGLASGIVGCGIYAFKKLIDMRNVETLGGAFDHGKYIAACFIGMSVLHQMMPHKKKASLLTFIKNKETLAGSLQILCGIGLLCCGYPKAVSIKENGIIPYTLLGVGLVAAGITQTYNGVEKLYNTIIKKK